MPGSLAVGMRYNSEENQGLKSANIGSVKGLGFYLQGFPVLFLRVFLLGPVAEVWRYCDSRFHAGLVGVPVQVLIIKSNPRNTSG